MVLLCMLTAPMTPPNTAPCVDPPIVARPTSTYGGCFLVQESTWPFSLSNSCWGFFQSMPCREARGPGMV